MESSSSMLTTVQIREIVELKLKRIRTQLLEQEINSRSQWSK